VECLGASTRYLERFGWDGRYLLWFKGATATSARAEFYQHVSFVDWLLDTLERDAVLVSGDVFDAANPPASATALWYRFLAQVAAWVAAVPFLRSADISGGGGDGAQIEGARRVIHGAVEAARRRRQPGQALLAMAHCHLTGGAMSDLSERKLVVGNQAALPADVFPANLSYVALGHLHLAQQIDGRASLQYAGSVLPLSFPERTYEHQVSLVELEGERVASIRARRIPRAVEVLSMPDDGPRPLDEVLQLLRDLPARGDGRDHRRPYLEVQVALDRPEPALRQILDEALEGKERGSSGSRHPASSAAARRSQMAATPRTRERQG
jgi:DNA repair exonuclease SbcCD nuclease subunit